MRAVDLEMWIKGAHRNPGFFSIAVILFGDVYCSSETKANMVVSIQSSRKRLTSLILPCLVLRDDL
jgi:hypothetical protein